MVKNKVETKQRKRGRPRKSRVVNEGYPGIAHDLETARAQAEYWRNRAHYWRTVACAAIDLAGDEA